MQFPLRILLLILVTALPFWVSSQTLNLGPDTTHCNSEPLVLDAGPGFTTYAWSTGDNTQTTVANSSGRYSVTVTNGAGTQSDTIQVTIHQAPEALFLGNNLCLGVPIPFINNSTSNDSVISWFWEFGDGANDTAFEPTHLYTTIGIKLVKLTVTTEFGCVDTGTNPVEVFGLPFVDAGPGDTFNVGGSVILQGSTQVHNYSWEPAAYLDDPFILDPEATPPFTIVFTLSVTDSIGCANSDTVRIHVNEAPDAVDDIVIFSSGAGGTIDVQVNDTDPNNDALVTTIETMPASGSAVLLNGDSISYTPQPAFNGRDTIVYRICDAGNPALCDLAYVYISIANIAPVITDDTLIVQINASGSVNVLANDNELNGQQVAISEISNPTHGTITDLGDGTLQYTPAEGYSGTDSFFYILCDNGSPILCDTGFVRITIEQKELVVSNSFTPNNDGLFDRFEIAGISAYPENHLLVFTRWGDKVFEATGYANEWDGSRDFNEELPEGIYFYQLDLGDGSAPLSGWIMLKR